MRKKPSELMGDTAPALPVPPVSKQDKPNTMATIVVLLLAGVLGYLVVNRIDWGDRHHQDDHHQKDDDKKQDDKKQDGKIVAKPGYLHVVRERIDSVEANESVSRIAEFAGKQTDLQWRDSDKDDPSEPVQKMVKHAKDKGIDPPFLLFKSKDDNQLRGVIKLPPASATDAQIMEVFR